MKSNVRAAFSLLVATLFALPLAIRADEASGRFNRAVELLYRGDYAVARQELRAFLSTKPDDVRAKLLLGVTLTKLSEQDEKAGDLRSAEADLREA